MFEGIKRLFSKPKAETITLSEKRNFSSIRDRLGQKISTAGESSKASYKSAYKHNIDSNKLVLVQESKGEWSKEYTFSSEWSEEDKYHYYALQFWTRNITHLLAPEYFPECMAIDPKSMVVEKRSGIDSSFFLHLSEDQQKSFQSKLDQIGLNIDALDIYGSNFRIDYDNQTFSYIDDIVDLKFFRRYPRYILETPNVFDKAKMDEYLGNLANHELKQRVLRYWDQYFVHMEHFMGPKSKD